MFKIHFITQGCSANIADSETMQGLLKEAGYKLVSNTKDADLIIFNTCTVKGPTESFFLKKLEEIKDKKIIIAGCIPQSKTKLEKIKKFSLIGTYQLENIVDIVELTLKGEVIHLLETKNKTRLNLPKIRKNNLIEIVPISHGCLGSCSYCKTKQARGQLHSYKINDIVRHISNSVKDGAKEIWLTSQDNSAYGLDINTNLVKLLKAIISIPRDFKIRVGMANPEHFKPMIKELITLFKHPKIYKFLHIPLQSGSDKVLKDMKRKYNTKQFTEIIEKFRKAIPDITIATDIICGYPTETNMDFKKTISLIKKIQPGVLNRSRFWPREGTPATKLKQLQGSIIKERTRELNNTFQNLSKNNYKKYINWKGTILVNEKGKNNTFIGRNYNYKPVIVKGKNILGKEINIKIISNTEFHLNAEII